MTETHFIPSDAREAELFCLTIGAAVGSSWEDETTLVTVGRLFQSLSSPLGNMVGSLSTKNDFFINMAKGVNSCKT